MQHDHIDLVVGAVFVLFYSAQRFNTPTTNRSSTTAARYVLALCPYCIAAVGTYFALVHFPQFLTFLAGGQEGELPVFAKELSNPLLVALLLTVLLPKLPLLSTVDQWLYKRLLAFAAIPHEVRRMSAALRKQPFAVAPDLQASVRLKLEGEGFAEEDIRFDPGPEPAQLWTRLIALVTRLEDWDADRKMGSYLEEFGDVPKGLRARTAALAPKAKVCFRLLRDTGAHDDTDKARQAARSYAEDFCEQVTQLHEDLLDFVSRGILDAEITDAARVRRLATLGFEVDPDHESLTLNQMMCLFGLVGISALSLFVIVSGNGATPGLLIARAVMISAYYCVAVGCAVLPKQRWAFARREPRKLRPVAFYFVAGLLAIAITQAMNFGFACLLERGLEPGGRRYLLTYPWLFTTFATAAVTAFLIDDKPAPAWPTLAWRAMEGTIAASVMMTAAYVTIGWLNERVAVLASSVPSNYSVPPLSTALALSGVVGFLIGFLVPTWYRNAPCEGVGALHVEPGDPASTHVAAPLAHI